EEEEEEEEEKIADQEEESTSGSDEEIVEEEKKEEHSEEVKGVEQVEEEEKGFSESDVGRRVRVIWDVDEAYEGNVDMFNRENGQAHVLYDDGDEEWLNPKDPDTNYEFLSAKKLKVKIVREVEDPRVVEEVPDQKQESSMRRRSTTASVETFEVEKYMHTLPNGEGVVELFLDQDTNKLYNMDMQQTFFGRLDPATGEVDRDCEDSDEDSFD
ncbi:hypothetical protein TrRE_jg6783, partial [Triparma retinervis]